MENNNMHDSLAVEISRNRGMRGMSTPELLWSTTWRGGVWLACAGAVLGAAYGLLLILAMLLLGSASGSPNASGACGYLLLVALIGGAMGGALGLVVGVIDGLLLGIVTRAYFTPLAGQAEYTDAMGRVSAVVSAVGVFAGFTLVSWGGSFGSGWFWGFVVVPAFVALFGGRWTGRRLAAWYLGANEESD